MAGNNSYNDGCGCWTIFSVLFLLSLLITYWPLFVVAALLIGLYFYNKISSQKQEARRREKMIFEHEQNRKRISDDLARSSHPLNSNNNYQRNVNKQRTNSLEITLEQKNKKLDSMKDELKKKQKELDDLKAKHSKNQFIPENLVKLAIDEELNKIDKMTGIEFEYYCGSLLESLEYENVRVTISSGDQGLDITATNGTTSYGFQCKNFKAPVGNKAVQEALAGKSYYKVEKIGVITNSTFTPGAKNLAAEGNVELWDRDVLKELIEDQILHQNAKQDKETNTTDNNFTIDDK